MIMVPGIPPHQSSLGMISIKSCDLDEARRIDAGKERLAIACRLRDSDGV
jgi:hypothetical protein